MTHTESIANAIRYTTRAGDALTEPAMQDQTGSVIAAVERLEKIKADLEALIATGPKQ